jgi:hypothetical protein
MGTRAVIHVDLNPLSYGKDIWIATHWDGNPEQLGKSLKQAIEKEISDAKKEGKKGETNMGDILQKAVWKAAADRHIDTSTTSGKKEFNRIYGDWAEYEYDVNPDGTIKVRERSGSWRENKTGNWKRLEEVV